MSTTEKERAILLTFPYRIRHRDNAVDGWLAIQAAHEIGEVVENGQVVLHGDNVVVRSQ
jgi:hypothetical protein